MNPEQLVTALEFKREGISQLPIVSTLLAALAMGGVTALITSQERGRLRAWLLVSLMVASLIFVFATVVGAMILPAMKRAGVHTSPAHNQALINLSRVVIWTLLGGILMLFGALGALGFIVSRRVGWWVLAAAVGILGLFAACCVYLDRAMGW